MADSEPSGGDDDEGIGRHIGRIETDPEEAHYDLLEIIADIEGIDAADLPPLYDRVDNLVEQLYTSRPEEKAQAQVEFTYYDYRVTIDQSGHVMLRKQVEQLELE